MRTEELIIRLFCMVDDKLVHVNKYANLYSSEFVTIGILFMLKGVHYRDSYRWFKGDWLHLFPRLPECSRLLRLLAISEYLMVRFGYTTAMRNCLLEPAEGKLALAQYSL